MLNIQFEDNGPSQLCLASCSDLRKNEYTLIKDRPCKIVDISTSKPDGYGHVYVKLVAIDIFTGDRLEDLLPSTRTMGIPNVIYTEYILGNIDDDYLCLLLSDGGQKENVKPPKGDLGDKMVKEFNEGKRLTVTVVSAMDEEVVVACREDKEN
ncbi:Eukaryotic translation initiation factor 5A [Mortierella polycephala]|uniref:Eukaryotic translation initiation factor 5A n=1 Tax=Mortierella polycephala TaxID=41804 RepID=A0A9P6PJR0_9FUNG|nr:Eukaryotic translation initiation factor 5A [Mortierella polycephala]